MRILKILGENLRSLEGTFRVELDEPPLDRVGLFAITGPTGAGKSTLLDALCLALFDRVPRITGRGGVPIGREEDDPGQRLASNDVRSVLRRGATQGWAEVHFAGSDGHRYQARWSVRRAHLRAGGTVQEQAIALHDLASGRAIGGTRRETLLAIEERLGLSYDQFRRSALLAQGDFSAFLRADAGERADLLERITGTEIYCQLSVAAFRRAGEEAATLHQLVVEAAIRPPIDEAARAALTAEEEARAAALAAAQREADGAARAVAWHESLASLAAAERQARAGHDDARRAAAAAAPQRRELAGLIAVQPLALRLQARDRAERESRSALGEQSRLDQALRAAIAAAERTAGGFLEADGARARAQHALDEARPAMMAARQIDRDSETLARLQGEARAAEGEARRQAGAARAEVERLVLEVARAERVRDAADAWLEARPGVMLLVEQWPRFRAELERLVAATHRAAALRSDRERLEASATETRHAEADARAACDAAAARLATARAGEQRALESVAALPVAAQREERDRLRRRRDALLAIDGAAQQAIDAEATRAVAAQDAARAEADALEQTRAAMDAEREAALVTAAAGEAQRALSHAEAARDLTERRADLVAGEPCPLCGAREHPWAAAAAVAGLTADLSARVEELARQRSAAERQAATATARATELRAWAVARGQDAAAATLQRDAHRARLGNDAEAAALQRDAHRARLGNDAEAAALQRDAHQARLGNDAEAAALQCDAHQARLAKDAEAAALQCDAHQARLQMARPAIDRLPHGAPASPVDDARLATLAAAGGAAAEGSPFVDVGDPQAAAGSAADLASARRALGGLLATVDAELAQAAAREEEADRRGRLLNEARGERERLAGLEAAATTVLHEATLRHLAAEQALATGDAALAVALGEAAAARTALAPFAEVRPGVRAEVGERLAQLLRESDEEARAASDQSRLRAESSARCSARLRDLGAADATAREREAGVAGLEAQRKSHEQAVTEARARRAAWWNGEPIDAVERRLGAGVAIAAAAAEQARRAQDDAAQQRAAAQAESDRHAQDAGRQAAALLDEERLLGAELGAAGVTLDELRARLAVDPTEIAARIEALAELDRAVAAAVAVLGERTGDLARHREGEPPALSFEPARAARAASQRALDDRQRELEGVRLRRAQDDDALQRAALLGPRLAAQRAVCARWDALSGLIGSHDGKKLRVFAQSLTLDALLAHANVHLEDLARRYRLERVPTHDLELQIIDRDMGDEARATSSLSGGETFLVSLALALALSSLASSRTRVDTLFIDEGLGTLDARTLEVALDALDALQATGRQVGVISHVPGLAERVGAEVRVVQRGVGRSRVETVGLAAASLAMGRPPASV